MEHSDIAWDARGKDMDGKLVLPLTLLQRLTSRDNCSTSQGDMTTMGMPTDPIKREEAIRRMREAAKKRAERPGEKEARSERTRVAMARPEVKEKMRQATLEQLADPKARAFIEQRRREANMRPEVRARKSEAAKKRIRTPESEAVRLEAMRQPEAIAKLSASQKERFTHPEARQVTSETTKAAMAQPEIKARMHEVVQRQWDNPETRETLVQSFQKRWERPEEHQKTSETTKVAMQKVLARPEFHEALSAAMQRVWADPIQRAKRLPTLEAMRTPEALENWAVAMSEAHRYRGRSSIEVIIATVLDALGIEYEEQKRIGRYIADFYIPGKQLVIECDGEYWHSERKLGSLEKDARKDAFLVQKGYSILRLTEEQIRKGNWAILEVLTS